MGNCQAAEAAAVVIQHPGGKVERLYGQATAGEVMRSNPGHYVALVVLRVSGVGGGAKAESAGAAGAGGGVKITKVKLLKPKDALLLGQVYRLITSQGACCLSPHQIAMFLGPIPPLFLSLGDRRAEKSAGLVRAEVAKAIQARRQDKTRRCGEEAPDDRRRPGHAAGGEARGQSGSAEQERKRAEKADRQHRSGGSGGGGSARGGRHWRPSLQSINESAS
ncbi:unnamed protein product [Urochloa decumbens]|uniref:Uncharacterized protein n=1 Tax=Urochloa decumbens TaxID=240449 RepID=A0ABC9C4F4_9POAL